MDTPSKPQSLAISSTPATICLGVISGPEGTLDTVTPSKAALVISVNFTLEPPISMARIFIATLLRRFGDDAMTQHYTCFGRDEGDRGEQLLSGTVLRTGFRTN